MQQDVCFFCLSLAETLVAYGCNTSGDRALEQLDFSDVSSGRQRFSLPHIEELVDVDDGFVDLSQTLRGRRVFIRARFCRSPRILTTTGECDDSGIVVCRPKYCSRVQQKTSSLNIEYRNSALDKLSVHDVAKSPPPPPPVEASADAPIIDEQPDQELSIDDAQMNSAAPAAEVLPDSPVVESDVPPPAPPPDSAPAESNVPPPPESGLAEVMPQGGEEVIEEEEEMVETPIPYPADSTVVSESEKSPVMTEVVEPSGTFDGGETNEADPLASVDQVAAANGAVEQPSQSSSGWDVAPSFEQSSYFFSLDQCDEGGEVGMLTANDPDDDPLIFTLKREEVANVRCSKRGYLILCILRRCPHNNRTEPDGLREKILPPRGSPNSTNNGK